LIVFVCLWDGGGDDGKIFCARPCGGGRPFRIFFFSRPYGDGAAFAGSGEWL